MGDSIDLVEKALVGTASRDLGDLIELMSVRCLLHAVLYRQLVEQLSEVVVEIGLRLLLRRLLGARLLAVVEVDLVDHGGQDAAYPTVLAGYVSQYFVHLLEIPVLLLLVFATWKLSLLSLDGSGLSRNHLGSSLSCRRGRRFGGRASFRALAGSSGLCLFGLRFSLFALFLLAALDGLLFLAASALLLLPESEQLRVVLAVGPQRPPRLRRTPQSPVLLQFSPGLIDGLFKCLSEVADRGLFAPLGLHARLVGGVRLRWWLPGRRSRRPVERRLELEPLHSQQRVCLGA